MLAPQSPAPAACICPHCGYSLKADQPVEQGRFRYDPREGFFVDGTRLRVPPAVHMMLGSLMLADGRVLTRAVLHERMGCEVQDSSKMLDVYLWRARTAFRALDVTPPIDKVWGMGLRWVAKPFATAA